jgi:hypothetical protein
MILCNDEIILAGDDFHFKVSVCRVDGVEFINDGCDSLVSGFGEDDGADVVFIWKDGVAEVHVGYVAYGGEATGYFVDFCGECGREDFICVRWSRG